MTSPRIPTGREIRQAREARGWTQARLGQELHRKGYRTLTRQNHISTIETGHRAVPRLMLGILLTVLPELSTTNESKLGSADNAMVP